MSELFPILFGHRFEPSPYRRAGLTTVVIGLPWPMIQPHEAQARKNHSQSLETLASRGGLSTLEALAVLTDRDYWLLRNTEKMVAEKQLGALLAEYLARPAPAPEGEP